MDRHGGGRLLVKATLVLLVSVVNGSTPPPLFTVHLNRSADQRWNGAVGAVLGVHSWEYSWGPVFESHNQTLFNRLTSDEFEKLADAVTKFFPEEAAELRGISAEFASHGYTVTFEYLCGWVYYHALMHTDRVPPDKEAAKNRECTGIVIEGQDGSPLFAGNMDQSPVDVRNITLYVTFVAPDGSVQFRGVDWYWFTAGVTRAVKAGVATLQENWRGTNSTKVQAFSSTMELIQSGAIPQVYVFRSILGVGAAKNFTDALAGIRSMPLAAPFYVIMSGPGHGDGVIIARGNASVDSELWLNGKSSISTSNSRFIVQTNYDQCEIVPPGGTVDSCKALPDSAADPRRSVAESTLASLAPVALNNELAIFATLSTYPVHNPHTAFTVIMDPVTGSLAPFVRVAMCPEDLGTTVQDSRYCAIPAYV